MEAHRRFATVTHVFHDHYSSDRSVSFDAWRNPTPTFVDDPDSIYNNVQQSVSNFKNFINRIKNYYKSHGHLLAVIGDDFMWGNA